MIQVSDTDWFDLYYMKILLGMQLTATVLIQVVFSIQPSE
jgi:hypothetical protein